MRVSEALRMHLIYLNVHSVSSFNYEHNYHEAGSLRAAARVPCGRKYGGASPDLLHLRHVNSQIINNVSHINMCSTIW